MHGESFIGMGHGVLGAGGMLIFFWLFVIFIFMYSLSSVTRFFETAKQRGPEEDVLKKRYAAGKITREEFNQKKRVLT